MAVRKRNLSLTAPQTQRSIEFPSYCQCRRRGSLGPPAEVASALLIKGFFDFYVAHRDAIA